MKFDLDRSVERVGTNCEKWDHLEQYFPNMREDALPLWVADMDFACAEPIQKALHARIDQEIFGYTHPKSQEYEEAVCGWFQRRFAWKIDASDIFYSPGVVPALAYLIHILSQKGQGIIIQEPVYHPFRRTIVNHERTVVSNVLLHHDGIYEIDFDDLEKKMEDSANVGLILCSPHNPVGRVWTETELNRIVDLAIRYDKWVISDEIHCDIIRKGVQHIPLAKLRPDALDRLIICTAPTKSFNLAGIKNSNIIIHNPEYQKLWKKEIMGKFCISEPNGFAHIATIAAYEKCEDWLNQVNAYIDANIAYACEQIAQHLPKAVVSPCEGTYLLWVDLRAYCSDKEELERKMQQEAGVLFDEGYIFGADGAGFERVNMACPHTIVKEALDRVYTVLENK